MTPEQRAIAMACSHRVSGHGVSTPAQVAAALLDEAGRGAGGDTYGAGGVVTEVEEQVRDLLGAEAAVLLPSGTMAQQIALRLHCDERALHRVAMHPTSHPVLHEEDALTLVQGLEVVATEDLTNLSGLAAVLVELPRRETGGQLMPYEALTDLSFRCAEAGVALHLDGARLWECGPAYEPRPLADVVALADTTYVSLYKMLGGFAGALLLCPDEQADAVRSWRHRLGGTQWAMWPLALAARRGLRERLPRVPFYVEAAQALAASLERVGLQVVTPPVTPLFHVLLPGEPHLVEVSQRSDTWLGWGQPGDGVTTVEISCGEATLLLDPDEVAALFLQAVQT